MTSFRSPLARVAGLGSAKHGSAHWWWQRITAVALVPLTLWFTFSAVSLSGACFLDIYGWMASPWVATLLIAFIVSMFYHLQLGLQVVIEDYLHHEGFKIASILAVKFVSAMLAILSVISILQMAL